MFWSFYFFLFLFSFLVSISFFRLFYLFARLGGRFGGGGLFFFSSSSSSSFCFLNLGCKQTYDSWRLGHVEPDDVVIADIEDQALDIFLHGHVLSLRTRMASERHSLTHPFPSTLLKQRAKPSSSFFFFFFFFFF